MVSHMVFLVRKQRHVNAGTHVFSFAFSLDPRRWSSAAHIQVALSTAVTPLWKPQSDIEVCFQGILNPIKLMIEI